MSSWLIQGIRFYQRAISARRPFRVCRFEPTCSQFMIEALERFGLKGLLLGILRILRCHPLAKGGYDPVPDHFTLKSYLKRQR